MADENMNREDDPQAEGVQPDAGSTETGEESGADAGAHEAPGGEPERAERSAKAVDLVDLARDPDRGRPSGDGGERSSSDPMNLLSDVNLHVKIELGRTRMLVEDVLRLTEGSVVELEKLAGDPVDVYVNDRLVARGEVLVLNDSFCVRVSEVAPAGEKGQDLLSA